MSLQSLFWRLSPSIVLGLGTVVLFIGIIVNSNSLVYVIPYYVLAVYFMARIINDTGIHHKELPQ